MAAKIGTQLHGLLEKYGVDYAEEEEFRQLDSDSQIEMLRKIGEYITPYEMGMKSVIHREIRLDLTSYGLPDCEFGTADLVFDRGDQIDLMDYKFGMIEVDDPEENTQMWLYALGCFVHFPSSKTVTTHVLQPALDIVGTAQFTRADIPRMLLKLRTIADRVSELADKVFNVVPSNCLWCGNKAHCTALHELVLRVSKHANLTVEDHDIEVLSAMQVTNIQDHIAYAGSIYDLAQLLEKWADMMKRRISRYVSEDGWEIPGKQLKTVGGKTQVVDVLQAIDVLKTVYKKTDEEILKEVAELSIGKLETFVAKTAPRGSKGATKEKLRKDLWDTGCLFQGGPSSYLVDIKE